MIATAAAEDRFASLLLCLVIVLVLGRLVAVLFRRIGQPVVIGEILVGIALGPSLLGLLPGDLDTALFPESIRPYLKVVASLGLVLFMFIVGMEVDLDVVRRSGRRAVAISLTSIALPFALGFMLLGPLLHDDNSCVAVEAVTTADGTPEPAECTSDEVEDKQAEIAEQTADAEEDGKEVPKPVQGRAVDFGPFAMFLGVSMCGTAFPVLARILAERNMFKIPLGLLLIACAAIDDIVAFTLLALAAALANGGGAVDVIVMMGQVAAFAAVLFVVVRPILDKLVVAPYRRTGKLGLDHLGILFIGLLLSSFITTKIGVHELIGAFLYGAAVPRRGATNLFHDVAGKVEGVSLQLLLPVFFVVAGQGVNIKGLRAADVLPTVAIFAVAVVGKVVGATSAALATGVPRRQAFAVGTMMNTRGLTELVILQVARDANVINDRVYTMLVIMAVLTTAMAGPMLKWVYPDRWLQRDIADADRRRTSAATDRIAVVVDQPDDALAAVELAAAYAGGRETGTVTLLRFTPVGAGIGDFADQLAEMDALRAAAARAGVGVQVISRAAADAGAAIVAEVERVAPTAVVLPAARRDLAPAIRRGGADVLVAGALPVDSAGVQVEGGSGKDEQAALEIGARLALFHGVPLHVRGGLGRRPRQQLDRLGVEVRSDDAGAPISTDPAADRAYVAAIVAPGERDRVPLTESLDAWLDTTPVVPLSSI
jgi:Kef-type K+ transport system membrane component KefB